MKLQHIEKLAVEVAELANREALLNAESARIDEELAAVRAAKAQKLQLLASGGNGAGPQAPTVAAPRVIDAKERVYQMVISDPSHVFTIKNALSLGIGRSTASVYLSELASEGRITRLSKGKYQASGKGVRGDPFKFTPVENDSTIPARIVALLASESESTFTAPGIAKRLGVSGESNVNSIRGALSRLSRGGKVEKVGRGGYKAVSTK